MSNILFSCGEVYVADYEKTDVPFCAGTIKVGTYTGCFFFEEYENLAQRQQLLADALEIVTNLLRENKE